MATMGTSLRNRYDNGLGYEYANPNGLSHSNSDPGPSQHETNGHGLNGTYVNYGGPSHQPGMPHTLPRHVQSHLVSTSHPPLPAQSHPAPLSAGFEHLAASGSIPSMSQPYINAHPSNPNLQQFTSFQPAPIPGPPYPGQHIQQHYVPGLPPVTVHAMPPPGYSFGQPPASESWPNHADWDDERDYIDGQEVIYGQLEVSPVTPSSAPLPTTPSPFVLPASAHVQGHQNDQSQCQDAFQRNIRAHFPSVPPPSTPSPRQVDRIQPFHPQRNESDHIKVKHRRRTTPEQLKVLEHWFDVNPKPDNNLREWLAVELGMTKRNIQVWFQNRQVSLRRRSEAAADNQTGQSQGTSAERKGGSGKSSRRRG